MSSSNTAIVLFRSAVSKGKNKQINAQVCLTTITQLLFIQQLFTVQKREYVVTPSIPHFFLNAYHNQPWRSPEALLVYSGSPLSGLWRIAGWAPGSAHVARRCSGGEAAARCSAAAWVPTPGRIPAAAHSASETCSSAGVYPAWYCGWQSGTGAGEATVWGGRSALGCGYTNNLKEGLLISCREILFSAVRKHRGVRGQSPLQSWRRFSASLKITPVGRVFAWSPYSGDVFLTTKASWWKRVEQQQRPGNGNRRKLTPTDTGSQGCLERCSGCKMFDSK